MAEGGAPPPQTHASDGAASTRPGALVGRRESTLFSCPPMPRAAAMVTAIDTRMLSSTDMAKRATSWASPFRLAFRSGSGSRCSARAFGYAVRPASHPKLPWDRVKGRGLVPR